MASTSKILSFSTLTLQRIRQESAGNWTKQQKNFPSCKLLSYQPAYISIAGHAQGGEARIALAKSVYYPYNRVVSYPRSTVWEALFPGLDLDSGLDWTLDWTLEKMYFWCHCSAKEASGPLPCPLEAQTLNHVHVSW